MLHTGPTWQCTAKHRGRSRYGRHVVGGSGGLAPVIVLDYCTDGGRRLHAEENEYACSVRRKGENGAVAYMNFSHVCIFFFSNSPLGPPPSRLQSLPQLLVFSGDLA